MNNDECARLESLALELNKKYYPNRLDKLTYVDPYEFIEKIGCTIEWKYLTPNMDILGATIFESGFYYVWKSLDCNDVKLEYFESGTIIINELLTRNENYKRETFVAFHEAMHWIKDKEYFTNDDNCIHIDSIAQMYSKYDDPKSKKVERETNYLVGAFLMPYDLIKKEFFKRIGYKNIPSKPIKFDKHTMTKGVGEIADILKVSISVVLYRLVDLHIIYRENSFLI